MRTDPACSIQHLDIVAHICTCTLSPPREHAQPGLASMQKRRWRTLVGPHWGKASSRSRYFSPGGGGLLLGNQWQAGIDPIKNTSGGITFVVSSVSSGSGVPEGSSPSMVRRRHMSEGSTPSSVRRRHVDGLDLQLSGGSTPPSIRRWVVAAPTPNTWRKGDGVVHHRGLALR